MSFTFQIWEAPEGSPLPADQQQAMELQDRVMVLPEWRNDRWATLQRQLLDRYPDEPADDGDETIAWIDNSLSGGCHGPCTVLGISSAQIDTVLAFTIVTANRLGLHVSDPQSGGIWLADGSVFALPGQREYACCMPGAAAFDQGLHRQAWESFLLLADAGNRVATDRLARMYHHGDHVARKAYVASALFMVAAGWRLEDGEVVAPAADAPDADFARKYRAALAPEAAKMADAMLPRLLAPGGFKDEVLAAYTKRERLYVQALKLADANDPAGCARAMLPLARTGHGPAQRWMAKLWALGEATPDDPAEELGWTLEAAKRGDDVARHHMGLLLGEGVLAPRDVAASAKYLLDVARTGSNAQVREIARHNLAQLQAPLKPAEIAAGNDLAGFANQFLSGEAPGGVDLVKAQALNVMASRMGNTRNAFIGLEQADPYAVRRLVDDLQASRVNGGKLGDVLARHTSQRAARAQGDGLSLVPASAPPGAPATAAARAPAPATRVRAPAPAPAPRAPARQAAPEALSEEEEERHHIAAAARRDEAIAAKLHKARAALAAAVAISLAVALIRHLNPGAPVIVPWLAASAVAAWGGFAFERALERPAPAPQLSAALMFIPFVGTVYAVICLVRIRGALA
jgi:TPR repeat protein